MIPILTNIPWKLIGAGTLILAIIVAAIGLVNYGQKLERLKTANKELKADIKELKVEVEEGTAWKDRTLALLNEQGTSLKTWQTTANQFETAYNEILNRQPRVVYRDVAVTVPEYIPVGDCNRAALASWNLLRESGLVEGVPP